MVHLLPNQLFRSVFLRLTIICINNNIQTINFFRPKKKCSRLSSHNIHSCTISRKPKMSIVLPKQHFAHPLKFAAPTTEPSASFSVSRTEQNHGKRKKRKTATQLNLKLRAVGSRWKFDIWHVSQTSWNLLLLATSRECLRLATNAPDNAVPP